MTKKQKQSDQKSEEFLSWQLASSDYNMPTEFLGGPGTNITENEYYNNKHLLDKNGDKKFYEAIRTNRKNPSKATEAVKQPVVKPEEKLVQKTQQPQEQPTEKRFTVDEAQKAGIEPEPTRQPQRGAKPGLFSFASRNRMAKQSKKVYAKDRASDLLQSHNVQLGADGKTYQLIDRETGAVNKGPLIGLDINAGLFSKNRRQNKLIGRELMMQGLYGGRSTPTNTPTQQPTPQPQTQQGTTQAPTGTKTQSSPSAQSVQLEELPATDNTEVIQKPSPQKADIENPSKIDFSPTNSIDGKTFQGFGNILKTNKLVAMQPKEVNTPPSMQYGTFHGYSVKNEPEEVDSVIKRAIEKENITNPNIRKDIATSYGIDNWDPASNNPKMHNRYKEAAMKWYASKYPDRVVSAEDHTAALAKKRAERKERWAPFMKFMFDPTITNDGS